MWLWLKRIFRLGPSVKAGDTSHTEAVLGEFETRAKDHKKRLRDLEDQARIARLQDKEEAHVRAGGGSSGHW